MEKKNIKEFDFFVVEYDKENYEYIKEIYRLHKDQQRKIFDLASDIFTDERIMDYIEYTIEKLNTLIFVAKDKQDDSIAGVIILSDMMKNACSNNG